MKKYILGIITIALLLFAFNQWQDKEISVGSDTVTPIAGQTYTLAGSGISSSDTSFTLTSFTITQNGYEIQDSDMSETFYITLEPGSRTRQEIISCTTVTQSSTDDTATISGCTRGLLPVTPYTASTSLQFAHAGGSIVIFSDPPQLFNQTTFKGNDETITGSWLFPTPLSNENAATKAYVDSLVNGGTVSNDRLIVAGTAGETVATGTLVYFNGVDQEWYKVNVSSTSTYQDKFIGLTQGNGTNGTAVSNGILLKGRDTTQTGLTAGSTYYATTSAGNLSTTVSSQPIGVAEDTNILYFDPVLIDVPRLGSDNTWSGVNTFTPGSITGHASTSIRVYTASTTWNKPTNLEYISIWVCGGGGGGGGNTTAGVSSGGGGGGGCAFEILDKTELTATSSVFVTIGAGGTAGLGSGGNGGTGGTSQFSTFLSGAGGAGGGGTTGLGGAGGTSSGGDFNLTGDAGHGDEADGASGGNGGGSFFGGGGQGGNGEGAGGAGQNYAGGGGGAANRVGGAGNDQAGGAGASGVVIITEYY